MHTTTCLRGLANASGIYTLRHGVMFTIGRNGSSSTENMSKAVECQKTGGT
jgi:hypothetical protein